MPSWNHRCPPHHPTPNPSSNAGSNPPPTSVPTALFLSELCDLLELPRPDPSRADDAANTYILDKTVYLSNLDGTTTPNYIDLYRRNCFVLEARQYPIHAIMEMNASLLE